MFTRFFISIISSSVLSVRQLGLLLFWFCRSCIYSLLTRGRPVPLKIIFSAIIFCSLNGFLQGHHLLHCYHIQHTWLTNARLSAGKTGSEGFWTLNLDLQPESRGKVGHQNLFSTWGKHLTERKRWIGFCLVHSGLVGSDWVYSGIIWFNLM